jgi:hypothetical protein
MNSSRESNLRAWILIGGILLIFAIVSFLVLSAILRSIEQAQRAVQPVSDLSNNLGTQVAQVLQPTPTVIVDPVTIVRQVRSLARLETIQYNVEKVITAEVGQGAFGILFGDRLLFIAHGVVIAGIDLSLLSPEDLRVENNVLYVQLPEPEIFIATLDNEKSYVYDRDRGALTRGDVNLETTARRVAEQEIRNSALEDGILEQASQNAENYLYRLLLEIGNYDEVIFLQSTTQQPTPQP